jgi:hypothetical protein
VGSKAVFRSFQDDLMQLPIIARQLPNHHMWGEGELNLTNSGMGLGAKVWERFSLHLILGRGYFLGFEKYSTGSGIGNRDTDGLSDESGRSAVTVQRMKDKFKGLSWHAVSSSLLDLWNLNRKCRASWSEVREVNSSLIPPFRSQTPDCQKRREVEA